MHNLDYKNLIGKDKSVVEIFFGKKQLLESRNDILIYLLDKNIHGRNIIICVHFKANVVYCICVKNHYWYDLLSDCDLENDF